MRGVKHIIWSETLGETPSKTRFFTPGVYTKFLIVFFYHYFVLFINNLRRLWRCFLNKFDYLWGSFRLWHKGSFKMSFGSCQYLNLFEFGIEKCEKQRFLCKIAYHFHFHFPFLFFNFRFFHLHFSISTSPFPLFFHFSISIFFLRLSKCSYGRKK